MRKQAKNEINGRKTRENISVGRDEGLRGVHMRNRHRRTMPSGNNAIWAKIREWQERMQEESEASINDMILRRFDTMCAGRNDG